MGRFSHQRASYVLKRLVRQRVLRRTETPGRYVARPTWSPPTTDERKTFWRDIAAGVGRFRYLEMVSFGRRLTLAAQWAHVAEQIEGKSWIVMDFEHVEALGVEFARRVYRLSSFVLRENCSPSIEGVFAAARLAEGID